MKSGNMYRSILLVIVLNILVKPLGIVLENIVQNRIGHRDYGIYSALFSLGFLFITFMDMGINPLITKRVAEDPENYKKPFANVLSLKLLLLAAYPLLLSLIGWLIGYRKEELFLLAVLSFSQALLQMLMFLRAFFQGKQNFTLDAFASVADRILFITLLLVVMAVHLDLNTFIYTRLANSLIAFGVFYILFGKFYGFHAPKLEKDYIARLMQEGIPFGLSMILLSVTDKVDQVMLERMLPDGEEVTGLYAASYRWLDAFMMYVWTIMPVFFARFSHASAKGEADRARLFGGGLITSAVPLIFVYAFILFYGDKLFWLYTNSTSAEMEQMVSLLKILGLSLLINELFAVYPTFLNASGRVKKMSIYVCAGMVLNVCLNIIFIPMHGAFAAAWCTVASNLLVHLLAIYDTRRNFHGEDMQLLLRIFVLLGLALLSFYLLNLTHLHWMAVTCISGTLLLITSYLFGFKKYFTINS